MKFRVQMKDTDVLQDAIADAVAAEVDGTPGVDPDEREFLKLRRREKVSSLCGRWFRYGEYLTVEIDTDAGTCVVAPRG